DGKRETGKVIIKDRITDAMFAQLVLRPEEYSVIAAPNLNGDLLSDAAAAQVGGLGLAPGGNVGDGYAVFEATHGTAPTYAGEHRPRLPRRPRPRGGRCRGASRHERRLQRKARRDDAALPERRQAGARPARRSGEGG